MITFMDYYTYDAMEFIAEKEIEFFKKIKKYFSDNRETIVAGLSSLNGYYPVIFR